MTAGKAYRVLVIDDEPQIRRFLRISLASQGYEVLEAESAAGGRELALKVPSDLVVLDLGLPDADGKEVLAAIREASSIPVIVLSVRSSEAEKVQVLDSGANDYVTKPFGVQELLARVRRLLRSAQAGHGPGVYEAGPLRVDFAARRLTWSGEVVHLTPKEYRVLAQLIRQAGQVVTQTQLLRDIWGPSHTRDSHYLRIVIGKIRQKLGDDADNPRYVETEPGVGYRFVGHQAEK